MKDAKNVKPAMDGDLAWQELRTEHIVRDEWIDFRSTDWRFPDGTELGPFYSFSCRNYVVVVASDKEGRFLCVRQFRPGIKQVTTEFPAGGIERKDGKEYGNPSDTCAEDPLDAAKRELLEETGYESDEWERVFAVPSQATICDNYAYIYRARNCRKVSGQSLDEAEYLNVARLTAEEIDKMIAGESFLQAMHVLAWLMVKEKY